MCLSMYELSDSILRIWHENFAGISNRKCKSQEILLLTGSSRHIWLTVWALLKAGLIPSELPGGQSADGV